MTQRYAWLDDERGQPDRREVEVLERNGNLTLVEDDTGRQEWVAPFEWEER